ncbi:MAG: hypothetical protein ABSF26_30370 [Thermoguttaceae bacterium]|jgi:hypothetical protein
MRTAAFRNRESVIRAIVRREREGLPLSSRAVQEASSQLHSGAYRHFGSWRNALQAAGIKATEVERRRQWDKAKIIALLRDLCSRGRSLRQKIVHRSDSGLYRAACHHFGTWCNALIAAGINPEAICRDPQWDRVKIIEAILLRVVQGSALGSTTVRPHTLKSAAVREFGSWPAALVAAGLEPADYVGQRVGTPKEGKKRPWNKERVRKAILQRHALGLSLRGNSVRRDDGSLFKAGRTCFGCWSKALLDAGFNPEQARKAPPWEVF